MCWSIFQQRAPHPRLCSVVAWETEGSIRTFKHSVIGALDKQAKYFSNRIMSPDKSKWNYTVTNALFFFTPSLEVQIYI